MGWGSLSVAARGTVDGGSSGVEVFVELADHSHRELGPELGLQIGCLVEEGLDLQEHHVAQFSLQSGDHGLPVEARAGVVGVLDALLVCRQTQQLDSDC